MGNKEAQHEKRSCNVIFHALFFKNGRKTDFSASPGGSREASAQHQLG